MENLINKIKQISEEVLNGNWMGVDETKKPREHLIAQLDGITTSNYHLHAPALHGIYREAIKSIYYKYYTNLPEMTKKYMEGNEQQESSLTLLIHHMNKYSMLLGYKPLQIVLENIANLFNCFENSYGEHVNFSALKETVDAFKSERSFNVIAWEKYKPAYVGWGVTVSNLEEHVSSKNLIYLKPIDYYVSIYPTQFEYVVLSKKINIKEILHLIYMLLLWSKNLGNVNKNVHMMKVIR